MRRKPSVRPRAEVDRNGAFPEKSIAALQSAGLLGAVSAAEVGGLALGPRGAAEIVRRVAQECGSTAMVLTMHYCGAAVLEAHAGEDVRRAAAAGDHLSTLAFSEEGSRSHFWAPLGTARSEGGDVVLDARKSWVTSASKATAYVWSSKPLAAEGLSTLWLVPANAAGIIVEGPFDGLGLRGNDSSRVRAQAVRVKPSAMLGADGKGFDIMMARGAAAVQCPECGLLGRHDGGGGARARRSTPAAFSTSISARAWPTLPPSATTSRACG